jgi:uncharacterized MAPEG superfamily protein
MVSLAPEVMYAALVAGFTGLLWIPIVLNRIREIGLLGALKNPERGVQPKADWAYRLTAAHRNAVENLAVFAPLALAVQVLGMSTPMTAMACMVFFWARVVHAMVYAVGLPVARTLAFTVGFLCEAVLFLHLFAIV